MIMFNVKTTKDFQHWQTDQASDADLTDFHTFFQMLSNIVSHCFALLVAASCLVIHV